MRNWCLDLNELRKIVKGQRERQHIMLKSYKKHCEEYKLEKEKSKKEALNR